MKNWILILFLGLPPALGSSPALLYAQHGHGGGAGLGPSDAAQPSAGRADAPGRGGAKDAATSSVAPHSASSSVMASKNPGSVLDHNTHLAGKLEGLLGLSGPNALIALKADAAGFKNFGQFVAAVHASKNLGIPFADLEAKMTGSNALSLGKAIHELKPDADATSEVKRATTEADDDVRPTSSKS